MLLLYFLLYFCFSRCFAVFHHVNYTRWGVVFQADMKLLTKTAPQVYEAFPRGDFLTKETENSFNKLLDDQALEHVIRSGKVAGGFLESREQIMQEIVGV